MSSLMQHELDDAITAVLDDMEQAGNQLVQVLEAEHAALNTTDCEALDQAGARKQACMVQLEQLDAERQLLFRERSTISEIPEKAWARIVQLLQRCERLNRRNGNTVNQRLTLVRQALDVLTGRAGDSGLYGRSGQLHASSRSQPLAAA